MSMKQKHLRMLVMLVFVFATFQGGLSENWHNCSTNTCKSFFVNSICEINSMCLCGVSKNQSTCKNDPVEIANQIGLNASSDQLSCCLCESNNTFCCSACQATTTPGAPTRTTTATTATPTSNPSPVPRAIVIAIFILNHDIQTYSSRVQELSLSFRRAVSNLTNMDNSLITVQPAQFLYGVLPYCGFQVTSYVSDPNIIHSNPQHCNSMVINATIEKDVSRSIGLADSVKLITDSVKEQKFVLKLWDGSEIQATFVLSKLVNGSFMFHRAPDDPTASPTSKTVPPIHTNVWPLIYSAIGVFSLITLCIVWQCCKQSYLLRKKKYTDINSNRVNTKKRKIQEAMSNQENSEKEPQRERGMFDMTHNKLQLVDNDALTRRYDWTTPAYVPNMLAPAYSPTELHGQHSPPRLMLDDDDSDSDKKSLGKASVINVDEETDEDLKDILESDDENGVFKERTNTRQSHASQKNPVPGPTKRKPSTISKASKSSRHSAQNASTLSTSKMPNSAIGQVRKCSYSGPEGRERTPSLGFGIIKANRITPVNNDGNSSVSSGKPRKKENSKC